MSTTLEACMILLSKQLGDYWTGTTTSGTDSTSIIDTALKAKVDDWVTDESYDRLTLGSYDEEERKITGFSSSAGDLTVLAHGGTVASGVTYEVHRLFTASEKRRALVHAAKYGFPHIFKQVFDETKTLGNWARNGCFTEWASASFPDYHRVSIITAAENTDSLYIKRGASSCKLTRSGADGYLCIDEDKVYDFKGLYGKNVTFSLRVFPDADDQVRLAIYDGTDTTYSDFNSVTDAFEELTVSAAIADNPSAVEFRIYVEEDGDVYVDDERIIGPPRRKIYIGDLDLSQNMPHLVSREQSDYSQAEPWITVRGTSVDKKGYLHIPYTLQDYRLRIEGIGYLDFYDSSGDVGTDWDDTIALDSPQTNILVAEAAIYLCNQKIVPNYTSGESKQWAVARTYWMDELRNRRMLFGMDAPSATVNFASSR